MKNGKLVEAKIVVRRTDCEIAKYIEYERIAANLERVNPGPSKSNHLLGVDELNKRKFISLKYGIPDLARAGKNKIWAKGNSCSACKVISSSGVIVLGAKMIHEDRIAYKVLMQSESAVNRLKESFENTGLEAVVEYISEHSEPGALTQRELEVLLIAQERGYFDENRRISLTELADALSVKPTSLRDVLRRGVKKIVDSYLNSRL